MVIQEINVSTGPNTGNGDPIRAAFIKINQNFSNQQHAASRMVGTQAGNVMEVGAFGLGENAVYVTNDTLLSALRKGFITIGNQPAIVYGQQYGAAFNGILRLPTAGQSEISVSRIGPGIDSTIGQNTDRIIVKTTANTQVDPNGFIKAASPIVNLYADKIELNDEAKLQDIIFEKVDVGNYLVRGSLGFAQEGWYIEMPKDANGNVLVAVKYQQLESGDIQVKTFAKKFDEETGDIVPNLLKPRDIPAGRFISLRLQELPKVEMDPPPTLTPPDFQPTNLAQAVAEALKDGAEQ